MSTARPQSTDFLPRAAGFLAIALWVAMAGIVAFKSLTDPANHSTFPVFHEATAAWWNGVDVYDRSVFANDFRYGPSFAVAMGPITWLPYRLGALVWGWFNVGITYWVLCSLARRVLPGMQAPLARDLFVAAAAFPSAHCLLASQTNLLIFDFVAFGAMALLDKRWWRAAFLLAIPVHIKIWPIAAALLLAACWSKRLAWRLAVALSAIAALPLAVMPAGWVLENYSSWYRHLVGPAQIRHTYRDAWTIWELISSPVDPRLYVMLQIAGALAVLGLCLWQAVRATSEGRLVLSVLVAWTVWQMILGPGTERNTFGLIAPMTSWGLVMSFAEKRGRWMMTASFMLTLMAAAGELERSTMDMLPLVKAAHPTGVLLFFGWYLWWEFWVSSSANSAGSNPAAPYSEGDVVGSGDRASPGGCLPLGLDQEKCKVAV